jgi:hypothetical protein
MSTVNDFTIQALVSQRYGDLSSAVGVVAVLLLIVLLILRVTMQAAGGPRRDTWLRSLDIAIVPLVPVFAVTIVFHLSRMMH